MHKIDQYRRGMELCLSNAAKAPFGELRAVWQSLGTCYAFLAELESWPGFGPQISDRIQPALAAIPRVNERSAGDRILP